jgi:Hypoxia induced protein conserved region
MFQGLAGTGVTIFNMMYYMKKGNVEKVVHWQRLRCAAQAFTISILSLNLLIPSLVSHVSFFQELENFMDVHDNNIVEKPDP